MQRQSEKNQRDKETWKERLTVLIFFFFFKPLVFLSLTDRSEKSVLFFPGFVLFLLTHLPRGAQQVGVGRMRRRGEWRGKERPQTFSPQTFTGFKIVTFFLPNVRVLFSFLFCSLSAD